LRNDFNDNDIFGDVPGPALTSLMEIVNTTDQGIVKAVRNGGVIKWLLKYVAAMRPEDLKNEAKKFVENYLSLESDTMGVAAVDSKADIKQIEPKDYVPNALIMDKNTQRIFSFFNTNEKIVQSKFNENEWIAYYESVVEPVAVQLSGEFTRKLFSRKERGFGNKIIFATDNLEYASMNTKLQLVQMVDRGAMLPNEWRETLGMGPIEGGDKPIRRLDTAVVNKVDKLSSTLEEVFATVKRIASEGGDK
jgi:phage portal protein BeeE